MRRRIFILDQFPSPTSQAIQLIYELTEQQRYMNQVRMQTEQKQGDQIGGLPAISHGCAYREQRYDRNCCCDRNNRVQSDREKESADDDSEQTGAMNQIAAGFGAPKRKVGAFEFR